MIVSTGGRSDLGLSRAKTRPLLSTVLAPVAPMNDMSCSTCGFFRMTSATARWRAIIASKDTSWAASVKAKMVPLSSVGMKPLGMTLKK